VKNATILSVHLVAAARPNFMKVAPLYHALSKEPWCRVTLVHTGQHYDENMSSSFFDDLGLPAPDHHLGVGSGTHAEQTAGVMLAYEHVCVSDRPDWVVVVGDVNSTVACSLVAAKMGIKIAHLEAGLRSFDNTMPEEINRIVTDSLADLLWTPSPDGDENLHNVGVPASKIELVGNIMIDSYCLLQDRIKAAAVPAAIGVRPQEFAIVTLHRPANVDHADKLRAITAALIATARKIPLVFSVHPRTRAKLDEFGLYDELEQNEAVRLVSPMSYIEFMSLVEQAKLVITDSGGIQEETTYLGIPCLTLRPNTERPVTVTQGTNQLLSEDALTGAVDGILAGRMPAGRRPAFWDGGTAARVVDSLKRHSSISVGSG